MSVWDEVVGQPRVVEQLQRAARDNEPTHAWLFTGPPGSGRSTAARALAAALLCEHGTGCGQCHACRTAFAGTHADVTNFVTENPQISIEEARELVVRAQDRPSVGSWRIMIVEDADRMTERTSNVMLKSIEEPPPHTIWLLCAPSPMDVLVTIRSRCRAVTLKVPSPEDVARLLVARHGVTEERAVECARLAQCHVGVATRLALYDDARTRRQEVVSLPLSMRGVTQAVRAADRLHRLAVDESAADAEARNDEERAQLLVSLGAPETGRVPPAIRGALNRLEADQKRRSRRIQTDTLDRFLIDLTTFYRDVLSVQLDTGMPLINVHLSDQIRGYATNTAAEQTLQTIDVISETRRRIRTNVSAQLAFEAMMVSIV
ncbi:MULTISPECIES: DNA polymerase III subunit delta' [Kocuria]|uniref:DNA polymerase III subunit delta' n=1 Tax=Kocuria TaxID=57493 RepID=UPI000307F77A|nr:MULTISPECIES: DNA polymerase III subunit delta' [Kocuria]KIC69891.1 DNA polymerase III subunit delta' [Kocuria rhizophila]MCG7424423.1 DNA polymerase III subunit delta' [Kocuria rhizophila]MCT1455710.1 DNA polymerase III subunit delta' [Kocuria rhizophila]MCT1957646.1 DNA polymerase III subunit delta' [Kocuria rhizophila]MCT2073688.1 DNA polymerase III subunit delta' [Kocuria rhizophila]